MGSEVQQQILEGIKKARLRLSNLHKNERVYSTIIGRLRHYLYSNTILLFIVNLNAKNMKELGITSEEIEETKEKFRDIIEKANSEEDYISAEEYHSFQKFIKNLRRKQGKLLGEIEKLISFHKCEMEILHFEKEMKKLGVNIERLIDYKKR